MKNTYFLRKQIYFLPVLLRYNWHAELYDFRVYGQLNDLTYIHHKMIATVSLVIIHYRYKVKRKQFFRYIIKIQNKKKIFSIMRTIKIYSLLLYITYSCVNYTYHVVHAYLSCSAYLSCNQKFASLNQPPSSPYKDTMLFFTMFSTLCISFL